MSNENYLECRYEKKEILKIISNLFDKINDEYEKDYSERKEGEYIAMTRLLAELCIYETN